MPMKFTLVLTTALIATLLMADPGSAYSYGSGYRLANPDSGGHSGPCVLVHPVGKASSTYFCKNGDLFHLWDLDSDSRSVGVKWYANGHSGLCRFAAGSPNTGDCRYDFPEGTPVSFYAGVCNRTSTVDCRSWSQYTNRTTKPAVMNA